MKDNKLYLIHIQECLVKITDYACDGKESFFKDTKTQDAVLRNLQTLSESTKRISEKIKQAHPEVDWRGIAGFRNVIVHDYLGINFTRIWQIIETEIPTLKQNIAKILAGLK